MNRSLIRFYYATAALAVVCMNGYNVGIDGSSLRHIFRFDFYFVTGSTLVFTIYLHRFTAARLGPVEGLLHRDRTPRHARKAFDRLTRFPSEVFRRVVFASTLFSAAYHSLELYWFRFRTFDELVVRHLVVEQAFGWTLAFVFMSVVRWTLRPYFRYFQGEEPSASHPRSFVRLWAGAFSSGLVFIAIPQLWYIRNMALRDERPSVAATVAIAFVAMATASAVMYLMYFYFQKEVRGLSDAMRALIRSPQGRPRALPVTAKDEVGELSEAIGRLHAKAAQAREEQDEDLALAAALQRVLLPEDRCEAEGIRIRCKLHAEKEVGGAFYDYLTLPDGRVALALGEVSGAGAAGALMMTAAVMLLRTELRVGGSAGEVLTRLNGSIYDTARGDSLVSLGLALVDPRSGAATYAGAGQSAPIVWGAGTAPIEPAGAMPLGALPDTTYADKALSLAPGRRLLLYSGGVAERFRTPEAENGFAAFRSYVETLPAGGDPEEAVSRIWTEAASPRRERDVDRALLMAETVRASAKEERRYA